MLNDVEFKESGELEKVDRVKVYSFQALVIGGCFIQSLIKIN